MKKISQKKTVLNIKNDLSCFIILIVFTVMVVLAQPIYGFSKTGSVKKTTDLTLFRIKMQGLPNYSDECVFYYQEGATNAFDSDYDAYKLFGPNPAPHISIDNDSLLMVINGIPPVTQTYSTNILATTHISGSFTITTTDIQGLPSGTCLLLKDLQTNTITNLLISSYVFNLSNTTTSSRFILTITYNTLPITSNLTQPSCNLNIGGKANVTGNIAAPWNYTWKDTLGTIIKTSIGINASDSLDNLSYGKYIVEIVSSSDACLRNEISFNINKIIIPFVSFTSNDTVISNMSQNLSTTNLSQNCNSYFWNFGDGIGFSNAFEPNYTYSVAGVYNLKMIGISNTGCADSVTKKITVTNLTTSLEELQKKNIIIVNAGDNNFKIKVTSDILETLEIELYDLNSKKIISERKENLKKDEDLTLNLNYLSQGIYLIVVKKEKGISIINKISIN